MVPPRHEGVHSGDDIARIAVHLGLHLCFTLFGNERLSHAEGDARFVHRLIRRDGHMDLVPHAKQEQSSFRAVDGDLPDEFVLNSVVFIHIVLFLDGRRSADEN